MKTQAALRSLTVFLLTLGIGRTQHDGAPPRTRVYDVRDLTRIERAFVPATAREASFVTSAEDGDDDSQPAIQIGELVTMVQMGTSQQFWEQEGVEIRAEDNGLMAVTCDEPMHARIRSLISKLRRLWFEPVLVEVHELPGAALAGHGSVLSSEEADLLLSKAGEHRVHAGRANLRMPLLLESNRAQNRIAGLHMRVAQDAVAPDLALATENNGSSWTVRALRTVGDALLVTLSGNDRSLEPGPACELPTGADGTFAALELPVTRIVTCHTSAYLVPGQALLAGSDAPGGAALCVRVRRLGPAAGSEIGEMTAYPVLNLVRGGAVAAELQLPYEDGPLFPEWNEPMAAVFDEGRLMEWLTSQVEPATWDGSLNTMNYLNGYLFVHAAAPTQQALVEQLRTLQGVDARQFTLEVRFGDVPADVMQAVGTANPEQLANALPQRCLATVSASREARISATRHTPYVKDYDVVVAASSAATTPELGSIPEGFLMRACVAPMDQGAVLVDLHLTMLARDPARAVFALQDPRFAQLDKVDVRTNKVRGATAVALDEWTILQLAPVEGGRSHVAVAVRVRSA